jgi:hypothetical protein
MNADSLDRCPMKGKRCCEFEMLKDAPDTCSADEKNKIDVAIMEITFQVLFLDCHDRDEWNVSVRTTVNNAISTAKEMLESARSVLM